MNFPHFYVLRSVFWCHQISNICSVSQNRNMKNDVCEVYSRSHSLALYVVAGFHGNWLYPGQHWSHDTPQVLCWQSHCNLLTKTVKCVLMSVCANTKCAEGVNVSYCTPKQSLFNKRAGVSWDCFMSYSELSCCIKHKQPADVVSHSYQKKNTLMKNIRCRQRHV